MVLPGASDFVPPVPTFPIPNIYLPLWYVFLAAFGWYMERRTRCFSRFNIFTVFVVAMYLRYGLAVPFSDGVNPSSSTQTQVSTGQLLSWYGALVLTYLGIAAGVEIVYRWRGTIPGTAIFNGPRAVDNRALLAVAVVLIGIVGLTWIVLPWSELKASAAAIIGPGHSAAQYRAHRIAYGSLTSYSSSFLHYLGSFTRFALLPGMMWVLWFHRKQSILTHGLFWLSLGMLALIGVASGEKMPALLLGLGFLIALVLGAGAPRIFNWKFVGLAAVGILVAIPVLYHLQEPSWSYFQLLVGSIYRETIEYSRLGQLRFVFYPDLHPFLYGQSSFVIHAAERVVGIAGPAAQAPEVYIPAHSAGVEAGYNGTWNAGFFAEAWADFGFVGVIVESVIVGVLLASIQRWFEKGGMGPLALGTYTALCVASLYLTETALLTTLWTFGLLSVFLLYLVLARFPLAAGVTRAAPAIQEGASLQQKSG
jgi:hypothetical protein